MARRSSRYVISRRPSRSLADRNTRGAKVMVDGGHAFDWPRFSHSGAKLEVVIDLDRWSSNR